MPASTPSSGAPTPSSPNWFQRNWVKCTAVSALIGVCVLAFKSCGDDTDERLARAERNISVLDNRTIALQENDSIFDARQRDLQRRMSSAEANISALSDSIDVHREEIDSLGIRMDSLETRVDTIAARQEKCPCINPKAKKPARRPLRPNNAPVRRDTIVVLVKPENVTAPVQNANGCGDDQNANVVIHGNNNTVNISNNGNNGGAKSDTTKTVTRRVTASCEATLVVNTVVTRNSYCK